MKARLFTAAVLMCCAATVLAQVPKTMSFQGYLTDAADAAIDGSRDFEFFLFESPNLGTGVKVWSEVHTAVPINKGLYHVILGSKGFPLDVLPFDKAYYLEIKILSSNETLDKRLTLTSSAYSINSINASTLTTGAVPNERLDSDIQDLADGSLSGGLVGPGINAANITVGTLPGVVVGTGINAVNISTGSIDNARLDSDLQDLADGSLSGTLVGSGIDASNVTTGNLNLASGKFTVNGTTGNLTKINNVTYSFPSTTGAAGTYLRIDDLSGSLSWSSPVSTLNSLSGGVNIAAGTNISSISTTGNTITINAAGGLAGSGAAGHLAYWNGTASVGDDNELTWNSSTNLLGVNGTINATTGQFAGSGSGGLTVGPSGDLTISSSGDITKIKGLSYGFPSVHNSAGAVLSNNGSGTLSWTNVLAVPNGGTASTTASGARTNLGLAIGSDVQGFDADLADLADGSLSGSKVGTGVDAANVTLNSLAVTNGGTGSSTASGARTNLGLAIGTDVQAYDSDLSDLASNISAKATTIYADDIRGKAGNFASLFDRGGDNRMSFDFSGSNLEFYLDGSNIGKVPYGNNAGQGSLLFWYSDLNSYVSSGGLVWKQTAFPYLIVPGGVHIGGSADPGQNNLAVDGTITGNGSGLTSLNASNLSSGTITNTLLDSDLQDLADGSLTGSKVGTGIDANNITTNSLSIANGGTAATSAGAARTNLGLVIGTNVQAYDADLADLADGSLTGSLVGTGISATNVTTGTLPTSVLPTTVPLGNGATDRVTLWSGSGSVASDADLFWNGTTNTLSALNFSGNGSALTSITAANISGTNTLPAAVLPTTVPLGNGSNGRLTFWTGTGAISSNANLNWDNTNSRLGVGESTPLYRLHAREDGTGAVANFHKNNASSIVVRFEAPGGTGTITHDGIGNFTFNAFTGAHYAYSDQSLDVGELVICSGSNTRIDGNRSEPIYQVYPSTKANDSRVLGSYSHIIDEPQMTKKIKGEIKIISALGNADIWVVDNGMDIEVGDYLISSNVRGHAMKDDGAFELAYVFARSAEAVRWSTESLTINGVKHRLVNVFFESFIRNNKADRLSREIQELKTNMQSLLERQLEIERKISTSTGNKSNQF